MTISKVLKRGLKNIEFTAIINVKIKLIKLKPLIGLKNKLNTSIINVNFHIVKPRQG